ncbi:MAG: 50S ribosomal protein L35 [Anaerolineaceae bacterium]|jgi:large subunit ribosomal protein L35|nr:50S ribosomal protein L35 [Anaerolineaceae bacterium]
MPKKQRDGKFKMKTHKATSKRFKMTGSGMIVRTKIGKGHLRRRTPDRTKQMFEEMIPVKTRQIKKSVRRLAPYMDKNS